MPLAIADPERTGEPKNALTPEVHFGRSGRGGSDHKFGHSAQDKRMKKTFAILHTKDMDAIR
jgi:hypothetical protein